MKAEDILFRASFMGNIMSGTGKDAPIEKSLTCRKELRKLHSWLVFGRLDDNDNKYTAKGTEQEDAGFKLLSRYLKIVFLKQETRFSNKFFTCIPDDVQPTFTLDLKCSWSRKTFTDAIEDNISPAYKYQGHVHMDCLDKDEHWLVYVLVNNSGRLIEREIDHLQYQGHIAGTEAWQNAAIQIEKNNIFELSTFMADNPDYIPVSDFLEWKYDIPIAERVHIFKIPRDQAIIESMKLRVTEARAWMTENLFKPTL